MAHMIGGWSNVIPATGKIQTICDKVKSDVGPNTWKEFKALEYRVQVVNGMNYLIKVFVGGSDYLHLMVYEGMRAEENLSLCGVQKHRRDDPLVPFYN